MRRSISVAVRSRTGAVNRPLWRVLGLPFSVAAVVGGSVGSGILRAPGPVIAALPDAPLVLLAWAAGGALNLVEATVLIELATAVPSAGGPVVFARRAFGDTVGLLVGWANWLQCVVSIAFMAVVFGEYGHRLGVPWPPGVVAVGLIVGLAALQLTNTRVSGGSQTLGSVAKAAAFVILFGLLAFAPSRTAVAGPTPPIGAAGVAVAMLLVANTYAGWGAVVTFAEEVTRPSRTIARSIPLGLGLVTILYVVMNVALLHALPIGAIARSTLPVADAVTAVTGRGGERIVSFVALLSVMTIANLTLMLSARVMLALARSNLAPSVLGGVAPNGSPRPAMLASAAVAGLLASSGAYLLLNELFAPLAAFVALATLLAAVRLRRTEPHLSRPSPMPAYPWPVIVGITLNLLLLLATVAASPPAAAGSLGMLVLAVAIARWARRRASVPGG